ncbi:MAG: hypothetical protein ACREQL_07295, partial [Candidatus Binatia bacterium]
SSVIGSVTSPGGVAIASSGRVFVTEFQKLYSFAADGSGKTEEATSTATKFLDHITFSGTDLVAAESDGSVLRRRSGASLVPFAAGLLASSAVRAGSGGTIYVGSTNGAVSRSTGGNLVTTIANDLGEVQSLGYGPSGTVYVARKDGRITGIDANGGIFDFADLRLLVGLTAYARGITVGPDETLYLAEPDNVRVDRITVTPPPPIPAAGTTYALGIRTAPALPLTSGTGADVDFGNWVPPYAGDYRLVLRSQQPGVGGEAVNNLHVGSAALGSLTAARASVPPGDAPVGVAVRVTGADFTSISRVEKASLTQSSVTVGHVVALGADQQGNTYYLSSANNFPPSAAGGTIVRKATAGGVDTVFFSAQTAAPAFTILMQGQIPVDSAGNLYVVNGTSGRELVRVSPQGQEIAPRIALTLPATELPASDKIQSVVINARDEIFALTSTRIVRIRLADGTQSRVATLALANPFAITADARDNLYVQFGNQLGTSQWLVRYRPDGSAANLVTDALFELEGPSVAGDCAGNVFVTASHWPRVGQSGGEEYTISQVSGENGAVGLILDGRLVNAQLVDIDALVYDRFSQSLLIWNHGFRLFRLPVTCGGIDAELRVAFPAGQDARGFNFAPTARSVRADGSIEYLWNLAAVTSAGKNVTFETLLPGMKLGERRPVAREAFLVFRNSFAAGEIRVPLAVPAVDTDAQASISVTTDKARYGANETVAGQVRIASAATSARSATVRTEVLDGQNAVVASLATQAVQLPATGEAVVAAAFSTGTTLAGSYRLRAVLSEAASGVELGSGDAGFDIVAAEASLVAGVATDRPAYDPFATVYVTGRAKNLSVNAIASNLTLRVRVTSPASAVILDASKPIAQLLPGTYRDLLFPLALASAAPGSYKVTATLLDSTGAILDARPEATFAVLSTADTGTGLRGSVAAAPRTVNRGATVSLTAFVENLGNSSVANLPVRLQIVNPATSQVATEFTFTQTLAPTQSATRGFSWNTTGAAAGTYVAVLTASVGTATITLGQDSIQVQAPPDDTTPDAFGFAAQSGVAPASVRTSGEITVTGINVAAPISVTGGRYGVNGGAFTDAPGTVVNGDRVRVQLTAA